MRELFIEKHAISTALSDVILKKDICESHHVFRRDREPTQPSRIPIRTLKNVRKSRNVPLCFPDELLMSFFKQIYVHAWTTIKRLLSYTVCIEKQYSLSNSD
jgi:hypothetical protein